MKTLFGSLENMFGKLYRVEKSRLDTGESVCYITPHSSENAAGKPILFIISDETNYLDRGLVLTTMDHMVRHAPPDQQPNFHIVCAHNNAMRIGRQIGTSAFIMHKRYAACVAPNAWLASILIHELPMRGAKLPILFAGLQDPDALGVSRNKMGSLGITGVTNTVPNFTRQIQTVLDLRPDLEKALIPYDMMLRSKAYSNIQHGNTYDVIGTCKKLGLDFEFAGCSTYGPINQDVLPAVDERTLLIMTRDSNVISQAPALLSACDAVQVPAFATDPQTTWLGAAFGTGSCHKDIVPHLAHQLAEITLHGKKPVDLPIVDVPENTHLLFNRQKLTPQGIDPNEKTLRALDAVEVNLLYKE